LKKLDRVHFLGSDVQKETWKKHGQPNLGTYTTQREDGKLSKKVTDQSKITWVINTFKTFKSAGTNEIVPAL
jgi:hypothetical protein